MIQPPVALGKMWLFAPGIPEGIVPLFVVKPNRFDNEFVSILPANGVPQPSWVGILGNQPPVQMVRQTCQSSQNISTLLGI